MDNNYLLEMTDINKHFPGVQALSDAQLLLKPGSVHALMGENGAGKSTLMKCLFGIYKKDSGTIKLQGKQITFSDPKNALDHGIAMVHQELNQVLRRNVMENIWLGRFPMKYGLVDHRKMYNETKKLLSSLELDIDPKAIIGDLSVSLRQMIEIAKAVSYNAKVLILDEPTSSLTSSEVNHLFDIIKRLTSTGVSVVYISHKLEEIKQIADVVTIMRDGKWITTHDIDTITKDEIIKFMVDRELGNLFPPKTNEIGERMLDVQNLSGKIQPTCTDISFTLHKGEILGVAGLLGSGRTELLNLLFGIDMQTTGEIHKNGKRIQNRAPQAAISEGFAYITEERRATGIFPEANVQFNSTISNLNDYLKGLLLSLKKMASDTTWVVENMNVKTPNQKTRIKSLSGGNQQKIIVGRALLTDPDILLLDEPTRGIDVGAKYEIYQLILDLANKGKSVIMVSSEMPELIGLCDRILVMSNGRLAGEISMQDTPKGKAQEVIMQYAVKYV